MKLTLRLRPLPSLDDLDELLAAQLGPLREAAASDGPDGAALLERFAIDDERGVHVYDLCLFCGDDGAVYRKGSRQVVASFSQGHATNSLDPQLLVELQAAMTAWRAAPATATGKAKPKAKQPKAAPAPVAKATQPKPAAKAKAEPAAKAKAKPVAKPVVKPKAKPVVKPKAKPVVKPKAKAKPAAKPKAKRATPKAKAKAKPAAKPKAKRATPKAKAPPRRRR